MQRLDKLRAKEKKKRENRRELDDFVPDSLSGFDSLSMEENDKQIVR